MRSSRQRCSYPKLNLDWVSSEQLQHRSHRNHPACFRRWSAHHLHLQRRYSPDLKCLRCRSSPQRRCFRRLCFRHRSHPMHRLCWCQKCQRPNQRHHFHQWKKYRCHLRRQHHHHHRRRRVDSVEHFHRQNPDLQFQQHRVPRTYRHHHQIHRYQPFWRSQRNRFHHYRHRQQRWSPRKKLAQNWRSKQCRWSDHFGQSQYRPYLPGRPGPTLFRKEQDLIAGSNHQHRHRRLASRSHRVRQHRHHHRPQPVREYSQQRGLSSRPCLEDKFLGK